MLFSCMQVLFFVGLVVLLLIGIATGHISFGTVEVKEDEHG
jgi:hypothetical protein